jgi:ABC-type amino acid transport system permease subunit
MKKLVFALLLLFSTNLSGQNKIEIASSDYTNQKVEMADQLRSDGKIYVVVAVILVILAGLFIYLFRIERNVKNLEKEIRDKSAIQESKD